ncbi:hypothetical protein CU097_008106 [Rhizopus azygosporus]|uniref:Uncharacterized protein n=1 Tax=Rhizopus azygosporus TaxID=86630 RepID=A0A367JQ50_RHIAZ|nr:hypothetical protein CU097_008106 [Rhizopus azygosporus]
MALLSSALMMNCSLLIYPLVLHLLPQAVQVESVSRKLCACGIGCDIYFTASPRQISGRTRSKRHTTFNHPDALEHGGSLGALGKLVRGSLSKMQAKLSLKALAQEGNEFKFVKALSALVTRPILDWAI